MTDNYFDGTANIDDTANDLTPDEPGPDLEARAATIIPTSPLAALKGIVQAIAGRPTEDVLGSNSIINDVAALTKEQVRVLRTLLKDAGFKACSALFAAAKMRQEEWAREQDELDRQQTNDGADKDPAEAPYVPIPVQHIDFFKVPFGYEVWADGVFMRKGKDDEEAPDDDRFRPDPFRAMPKGLYKNRTMVIRKPLWVRRLGKSYSNYEPMLELATIDDGKVKFVWVTQREISIRNEIVNLAQRGFQITSVRANDVIEYLDAALTENQGRLPTTIIGSHIGEYEDRDRRTGWLLGSHWIGECRWGTDDAPAPIEPDVQNNRDLFEAYGIFPSTREDGWKSWHQKTLRLVDTENPIARWMFLATFTAPLLRFIGCRTFILHHLTEARGGKTGLAKLGMSAWGDPNKLTLHFNRTLLSITEAFRYVRGIPVLFDELQVAELEDFSKVIYAICLESPRVRSKRTGGLQEDGVYRWRTMVRTTGEMAIVGANASIDLGGQAARVLQIRAPAFSDHLVARGYHQWMEKGESYGWGGHCFLMALDRFLVETANEPDTLPRMWQAWQQVIAEQMLGKDTRQVPHLAAVALANQLALEWLYQRTREEAEAQAIADTYEVAKLVTVESAQDDTPIWEKALQMLRDYRYERADRWLDITKHDDEVMLQEAAFRELFGVITPNEVWFVPGAVDQYLALKKIPKERVWPSLRDAGLMIHSIKNLATWRQHGRFHLRCYVLPREVFEGQTGEPVKAE
jgi:hypothetical protein